MRIPVSFLLFWLISLVAATVEVQRQIQLRESLPCFDDDEDSEEGLNVWAALESQITNMSDVAELSTAMSYYFAELNAGRYPCDAAVAAATEVASLDTVTPPPSELCEVLFPLAANHPLMSCLRTAERISLGALLYTLEEETAMFANAVSQQGLYNK